MILCTCLHLSYHQKIHKNHTCTYKLNRLEKIETNISGPYFKGIWHLSEKWWVLSSSVGGWIHIWWKWSPALRGILGRLPGPGIHWRLLKDFPQFRALSGWGLREKPANWREGVGNRRLLCYQEVNERKNFSRTWRGKNHRREKAFGIKKTYIYLRKIPNDIFW